MLTGRQTDRQTGSSQYMYSATLLGRGQSENLLETCSSGDMLVDRQTYRFITILHSLATGSGVIAEEDYGCGSHCLHVLKTDRRYQEAVKGVPGAESAPLLSYLVGGVA